MKSVKTIPFMAFVKDADSTDTVRSVFSSYGWSERFVHYGDVRQAVIYLKEQDIVPQTLLVEIPSASEAPELLDRLADVCTPEMRVVVAGKVDEFSFYSWLQTIGIEHYLLQPFDSNALHRILHQEKEKDGDEHSNQHKVIAVTGARGGVGATTIATNLAYILAEEHHQKTAFLDLDPYYGTAAMIFDVTPNHGLREIMDKPERIDERFLNQVMVPYSDNLSILAAEEAFKQSFSGQPGSLKALMDMLQQTFQYTIIDVPRSITPLSYAVLERADEIIAVGELSLLSLRDMLRLRDYLTDTIDKSEPVVVMNREGLASKHELNKGDFEKNYGSKIDIHIPCMMEAFSASSTGEMLIETTRNSSALDAMHSLADKVALPQGNNEETEKAGLWNQILGRIRHVR